MIIYCDSGGNVSSVPSVVSFGETLRDITIIAHQSSATAVLKIKPPNAEYLPDIICAPLLTEEGVVVYIAHLPKSVTMVAGRCLYQLEFVSPEEYVNDEGETIGDIKKWSSFDGSFNVSRAVPTDLPASENELKDQSLDSLYAMLASVKRLYDQVAAMELTIGIGKELETKAQNLIDAMNELHRNGAGVTIDLVAEIANRELGVHNSASGTHSDIRLLISNLEKRLNFFLDGDDVNLDQVKEIVTYIKSNRDLIEQVTNGKISVDDIVDNLTTGVTDRPLSANQGVILKNFIDRIGTDISTINTRLDRFVDEVLLRLPIAENVSV